MGARAAERRGAATCSPADTALARIQPELIRAHMRFLADDLLEGRGTGTRGHRLAALYVAAQFEQIGLEPAGDGGTYLQTIRFSQSRPRKAECSLALIADGQTRLLAYGTDFVVFADPGLSDATLRTSVAFVRELT